MSLWGYAPPLYALRACGARGSPPPYGRRPLKNNNKARLDGVVLLMGAWLLAVALCFGVAAEQLHKIVATTQPRRELDGTRSEDTA